MSPTRAPDPDQYVGAYGPAWRWGVLSEHLVAFAAAGGTVRTAASGEAAWAVLPDGSAYPVVCSDLVQVWTEDGPAVGRCGAPAGGGGQCESHGVESAAWLAASEAERLAWEKEVT